MVDLSPEVAAAIDAVRLDDSHGASPLARLPASVLKLDAGLSLFLLFCQ